MCKVMIIPHIKKEKRELAVKFIKAMGQEMSFGNNDGLGYAAVDEEGKLFGERWLINKDAFKHKGQESKSVEDSCKKYSHAITGSYYPEYTEKSEYNSFGQDPSLDKAISVTLHTRFATSSKGMQNTHPFVYEDLDTSLIHNGVISNDSDFPKSVSTCDSEAILYSYLDKGVNFDLTKMQDVASALRGYYACGVYSRDEQGNRVLDFFKGNHARLCVQEIKELGCTVITTEENDVVKVCRELGLTKGKTHSIKEGVITRINPFTDEVLGYANYDVATSFSSRGSHSSTQYWNNGGTKALAGSHTTTEGGVFDASLAGQRERKKQNLSKEQIAMMKLPHTIRRLSVQEIDAFIRDNCLKEA